MLNLDGSVSYIFLIFGWFSFLISPISYGRRFLFFSYIFSKNISSSLWQKILIFLLITALLLFDLNAFFFELSAFWHLFGYFSSKAIHFLVVNKKKRFLFWKIQWVAVSYDWRIWWVVSYKSVSYRKGMRVQDCNSKCKKWWFSSVGFWTANRSLSVLFSWLSADNFDTLQCAIKLPVICQLLHRCLFIFNWSKFVYSRKNFLPTKMR